jgi:sulfur-oxidizing protein SoxB
MSSMNRREFLQILAAASAAGFALDARPVWAAGKGDGLYDLKKFGNVHLLHFTDCHAQLLPVHFREPSVNLGIGGAAGKAPHLVGEHLLKAFGIKPGGIEAHAFTYLNFEKAARPTARSAASPTSPRWSSACAPERPGALLLDGGDTWQGSATALVDQGPGHGRRLQAARRGHDDRRTGNSPWATSACWKSSRRT